jgi:TetR/AcrR family transcriptional regulator, cholesterol catabolism regulator
VRASRSVRCDGGKVHSARRGHVSGVTKGAFYHHFESKAHLIMAIHNGFVDLQISEITAIIEKDLASVSLFMREYPAMPRDVDRAVRARRLEYEQLLVSVIDRGREAGVFHTELPTNVLLYGILGMGAWATQWYDPKRAPSPEVIGRNYARMVVDGLTAPITGRTHPIDNGLQRPTPSLSHSS